MEPLLGCRFVLRRWHPYWETRDDLDQIQFCSLVNTEDIQNEIYKFMSTTFDPKNDPQFHVRVFRCNNRDTLCIKMNHMIADGAGLHDCIYTLAHIYGNLFNNPLYSMATNTQLNRNISQIFKYFNIKTKFLSFRQWNFPLPDWGFPLTGENIQNKYFVTRQTDSDILLQITKYRHKHRVTLNDVIITAYYRSLLKIIDPKPNTLLKIQVIVDLRRYLHNNHIPRLCNFYSAIYPRIPYDPEMTFHDTLMKIHNIMDSKKKNNPGLMSALYGEMAFKLGFANLQIMARRTIRNYFKTGKLHPTISNLGIIDHERLLFHDVNVIDTFGFSPAAPSPGILVIFSSFRNKITFSISYRGEEKMGQLVNNLLDLMVNELSGLE